MKRQLFHACVLSLGTLVPTHVFADGEAGPIAAPLNSVIKRIPATPEVEKQGNLEIIRERYPTGKVKIVREVTQDAQANYLNHGSWKLTDEAGTVQAEGRYENGERSGPWTRILRRQDAAIFQDGGFAEFAEPFTSQVTFDKGKAQGKWLIVDAKQRRMLEIELVDGQRHGKVTQWHVNGEQASIAPYVEGVIDGVLIRWDATGKQLSKQTFQKGRELIHKLAKYPEGSKKEEGDILTPTSVVKTPDNWFETKLATYSADGKSQKLGSWTAWYSDGQVQSKGKYENFLPSGEFVWWHQNGQQSAKGSYENGKPIGEWIWWHENGQKKMVGKYEDGTPAGEWVYWNNDGKLTKKIDHAGSNVTSEKGQAPSAMLDLPLARLRQ